MAFTRNSADRRGNPKIHFSGGCWQIVESRFLHREKARQAQEFCRKNNWRLGSIKEQIVSKTTQRKRQAFQDGLNDGKNNLFFKWKNHPFLDEYERGYSSGRAIYIMENNKLFTVKYKRSKLLILKLRVYIKALFGIGIR